MEWDENKQKLVCMLREKGKKREMNIEALNSKLKSVYSIIENARKFKTLKKVIT